MLAYIKLDKKYIYIAILILPISWINDANLISAIIDSGNFDNLANSSAIAATVTVWAKVSLLWNSNAYVAISTNPISSSTE